MGAFISLPHLFCASMVLNHAYSTLYNTKVILLAGDENKIAVKQYCLFLSQDTSRSY